ncbi:MAG: sulfotransferase family protein [Bacteroidota bacterium]
MLKDKIKRICLWSGPRNISTALMYSFAQRSDTLVYDEPLYAYYLSHSNAKEYHPGAEDVLASMENDGDNVIQMMMGGHNKPVVFFKHMTHHLLTLDRSFMKDVINIILTRDPVEMLPSFAKAIEKPTMKDVGYAAHIELLAHLHKIDVNPIVIDSKKLLLNPKKVLLHLCKLLDISFNENMLQWKAGARPEDGIWAKYWYKNVHESIGFKQYNPKFEPFPENLKPLLEACIPYYKELMKLSIG